MITEGQNSMTLIFRKKQFVKVISLSLIASLWMTPTRSFASEGSDDGPVYMIELGQPSPVTGMGMRRDTFEFYESAREGLDACKNRESASLDGESGASVTWQGVAIGFGVAASLKLILDSLKK